MAEVEIGGHRYRTGRLDAFKQFHLFRKLMPILSGMGESFSHMPDAMPTGSPNDDQFWSALGPVANAIAEMSQADTEFILKTAMNVCQVWNGNAWVRITAANGDLMFEDIDMMQMLQLTFEVLKDNLSGFFPAPLPNGSAAEETSLPLPMPR